MKENNSLLDYGLRKLLACGLSIWQSSGGPPDRPVWESAAIKLRITGWNALYKHLERKKKLKKYSETYLSTLVDIFLHGVNRNCYLRRANAKRHIKSGPKKIYHDKIQRRRLVTWLHSGITSFEDECHVILWWWSWIRSSGDDKKRLTSFK